MNNTSITSTSNNKDFIQMLVVITSIAYRNFVQSIKSPRSREKYAKSSQYYMNWLSLYDYDTILRKDPKLIASDIIDYIIYLKNEKKLAPATISTQVAAIYHFYELNDVELILFLVRKLRIAYKTNT
jgi:hypothetical protein